MRPFNQMKLTVPSRSVNEAFVRGAVAMFAASLDPACDVLADIKTAVSEAVTNCIVHAYPDTVGLIYITASLYPDGSLTVRIADKGCGIADVARAREPLFTTAPEKERSGLGFSVMESFMDKLTVRSTPNKGTVVTMKKHLTNRQ